MKNIALAERTAAFDVNAVRRQFPILARMVRGKPLAYLDNGASAQRPAAVIDAVDDYERHHHANIHRGVHTLSRRTRKGTPVRGGGAPQGDRTHGAQRVRSR
jgi:cysteine desulfurase/selenocysteine lyase